MPIHFIQTTLMLSPPFKLSPTWIDYKFCFKEIYDSHIGTNMFLIMNTSVQDPVTETLTRTTALSILSFKDSRPLLSYASIAMDLQLI